MAGNKSYTISKSLNGDTLTYIARTSGGVVFARELTMEALEKAIKIYKEPPPKLEVEEPEIKEFLVNELREAVQERKQEKKKQPSSPRGIGGKFVSTKPAQEATLSAQPVDSKPETLKKKSFWSKLG